MKKNEASQKCISLVCSLFELLRFWASEDREHFEALRTFQARWARSEEHYVLQCFSAFRDSFDARYKARRGSKLFVSQDSRHVCSETGFHAHHVEGNRGRCAAKRGSKHFDYHNIVTVCSETGFQAN